eukprot:1160905-Pelagomonas_calceolata.AAC.5
MSPLCLSSSSLALAANTQGLLQLCGEQACSARHLQAAHPACPPRLQCERGAEGYCTAAAILPRHPVKDGEMQGHLQAGPEVASKHLNTLTELSGHMQRA